MNTESTEDLKPFFEPKSVAVIGASNNYLKRGCMVLGGLITGGYRGEIYPVNSTENTILGLRAYKSVAAIGKPVDLAFVVTPARTVTGILQECIAAKIRAAVVITSGFAETGREGKELEKGLVALARQGSMRIVGPNSMGIYSASTALNALITATQVAPGDITVIAQSGNLGMQIILQGSQLGIGFRAFVSIGNEADISFEEYLRHFLGDPGTKAIVLYMEGVSQGPLFLETLRRTTKRKPVIILKGGRTSAGSQAALSHTGALAGDHVIVTAALRQAGALVVDDVDEILDLACALFHVPFPKGNRMGVLTRGGGWGVLCADRCEESGLELPPLNRITKNRMDQILPFYWSKGNPVDMVAEFDQKVLNDCLGLMAHDPAFDGILALGVGPGPLKAIVQDPAWLSMLCQSEEEITNLVKQIDLLQERSLAYYAELIEETGKPILIAAVRFVGYGLRNFNGRLLPIYPSPERTVRTMANLLHIYRSLNVE